MTSDVPARLAALRQLRSWDGLPQLQDAIVRLGNLRTVPNVFRIVPRARRVEGVHSDLVHWLLTPGAWHGLGDSFAVRVVRLVLAGCGEDTSVPMTIGRVRKEFSTGGQGTIDILLHVTVGSRNLVVGIENKIDSRDGPDQLLRYERGLTATFGAENIRLAYLTLDGSTPGAEPTRPYACLSYRALTECLADTIKAAPRSDDGSSLGLHVAQHYLDWLQVDVMKDQVPETREIQALCQELYDRYPTVWREVCRLLPSEADEVLRELGSQTCERLKADCGGEWRYSVKRGKYARVFRPQWRQLGSVTDDPIVGWDAATPLLDWHYAAAHLRLYVTAMPEEDDADEHEYRVSLKVDTRAKPEVGDAVTQRLKLGDFNVPSRDQFTIPLKSKGKLPSVRTNPDPVIDWLANHTRRAVDALDAVLQDGSDTGTA